MFTLSLTRRDTGSFFMQLKNEKISQHLILIVKKDWLMTYDINNDPFDLCDLTPDLTINQNVAIMCPLIDNSLKKLLLIENHIEMIAKLNYSTMPLVNDIIMHIKKIIIQL